MSIIQNINQNGSVAIDNLVSHDWEMTQPPRESKDLIRLLKWIEKNNSYRPCDICRQLMTCKKECFYFNMYVETMDETQRQYNMIEFAKEFSIDIEAARPHTPGLKK